MMNPIMSNAQQAPASSTTTTGTNFTNYSPRTRNFKFVIQFLV
ncbi:MAG TPA: hypothetical protein VFD60_11750 [Nitrososphaeraceae archaeon]|nr:hypothetical protein [Nitrososphaeraceae archaeon]